MATTTDGFGQENLSVATQDSIGVQFLQQVVNASVKLHKYRYEHREVIFKDRNPHLKNKTINLRPGSMVFGGAKTEEQRKRRRRHGNKGDCTH